MNLNFDIKWYQNIADENYKLYGCSVPWHPSFQSNLTGDDIATCRSSEKGLLATKNYDDLWADFSPDMVPCATFEIFPGLSDIDDTDNKQDEAYIRLYFKTKIKVKKIIIHYDAATLSAEIGGFIGMILGVSIIDLVILLNAFFLNMNRRFFDYF